MPATGLKELSANKRKWKKYNSNALFACTCVYLRTLLFNKLARAWPAPAPGLLAKSNYIGLL